MENVANQEGSELEGTERPAIEQPRVSELEKALAEEKERAEHYLASWQRAQADFINLKRTAEIEREQYSQFANVSLVLAILPVLDDFERALNAITPEMSEKGWLDGVKLIERKLRTVLENQGLSSIKAAGEPFDPRLHEAVRQAKGPDGIVVAEVQKGYRFRDKVIRPSKVVVGNGEEQG